MYFVGFNNDNIQFKRIYKNNEPTKYLICNQGFVFNESTNGIQTPRPSNRGYLRVCISHKGDRNYPSLHRLVAQYFIDNPRNLPEVNHKNGNKYDNTVDNLEWVTSRENVIHSYDYNLNYSGEKSNLAKTTDKQVHQVCKLLEENELSIDEIAKITNTTKRVVRHVLKHKTWNRLSKDYNFEHYDKYQKNPRIINCNGAKLTPKQVNLICSLIEKNQLTLRQIADATEIPYRLIRSIYFKKSWIFISDKYDFSEYDKY